MFVVERELCLLRIEVLYLSGGLRSVDYKKNLLIGY